MKRIQTTTNLGNFAFLGGFLQIFQKVKINEIWTVLTDLTCGELVTMILPFGVAVIGWLHNEDDPDKPLIKKKQ